MLRLKTEKKMSTQNETIFLWPSTNGGKLSGGWSIKVFLLFFRTKKILIACHKDVAVIEG